MKTFTDAEILSTIVKMTRPMMTVEGLIDIADMAHIQDELGRYDVHVEGSLTGGRHGRRACTRNLPNVTPARVVKIAQANGYTASPGWYSLEKMVG